MNVRRRTFHIPARFRRPEDGEEVNPETARVGADGWIIERLSP